MKASLLRRLVALAALAAAAVVPVSTGTLIRVRQHGCLNAVVSLSNSDAATMREITIT